MGTRACFVALTALQLYTGPEKYYDKILILLLLIIITAFDVTRQLCGGDMFLSDLGAAVLLK